MTQSPRYCERIFYPELIPLKTEICNSTQPGPGGDHEEYLTFLERTIPSVLQLSRQSMTASGASSFLLDAGTDITLYRLESKAFFFYTIVLNSIKLKFLNLLDNIFFFINFE